MIRVHAVNAFFIIITTAQNKLKSATFHALTNIPLSNTFKHHSRTKEPPAVWEIIVGYSATTSPP